MRVVWWVPSASSPVRSTCLSPQTCSLLHRPSLNRAQLVWKSRQSFAKWLLHSRREPVMTWKWFKRFTKTKVVINIYVNLILLDPDAMNKSAGWWGMGSRTLQRHRQGSVCLGQVCQLWHRSALGYRAQTGPSRNWATAESFLTSKCSEAARLNGNELG